MKNKIAGLKSIYEKEGFQKYFKNTSWLLVERVFRMFMSLVVGVWVARYLGPADYGAFQFAFSFVSIFLAISTLGLDDVVIRELVQGNNTKEKLLGTAFCLKIGGAFLSLIILLISIQFLHNEEVVNFMIVIIGATTLLHGFNVIDFYFRSEIISKYVTYANFFSLLSASIAKIILILINAPLISFAIILFVEYAVLALGFIYYYHKTKSTNSIFKWEFDWGLAKELLGNSWPLIFSGMILMLQARIDQVMIKEISTNEEVGYYSVALRLVEIFGFLPVLLSNSLFPSLVNTKKVSERLFRSRLLNYYRLNFALFLIIALPIYFFSDFIINVLYGVEYAPVIPILSFMTIRLLFANMGTARGSFINIENLFKYSMITMVIGTLVNICLNWLLIPEYLSMGAIFSTIVSFSVTIFIIDIFYFKTRGNVILQFLGMLTFFNLKLEFLKAQNPK